MTLPSALAARRISTLIGWKYSGNITQAASEIGCGYWPLYRLVKGGGKITADLLQQCAAHFGVTLDQLMAPDEEVGKRRRRVKQ
jgi:hypothetical protein